jgi:hypothetical protein
MTGTGDHCVKRLGGSDFDTGIWRRKADSDVACNAELCRRRFRRVCLARGRNLDDRRRGHVTWRRVNPAGCDSSVGSCSAWNAIHAPGHVGVCRVCDRRDKCLRVSQ